MAGEKSVNNITFRIRHTMMLVSDLDRSIDVIGQLDRAQSIMWTNPQTSCRLKNSNMFICHLRDIASLAILEACLSY